MTDQVAKATLEIFAENDGYNQFLWKRLSGLSAPCGRVLEVGCGIGNLTALLFKEEKVDAVHAIDMEAEFVQGVKERFDSAPLTTSVCVIEEFKPPQFGEAADASFDTIVCSNVLEHIEDHVEAMREFARLLRPGGQVLLLVPAHRWLFCDIDRNLHHFRRYRRSDFRLLEKESGLQLERLRHFNPLGVLGWWLNGKVLRRGVLPQGQVRLYSRYLLAASALVDRLNPFPLGVSLTGVFRKPLG